MKTAFLKFDNLADRKEVFYLLEKLSPRKRLRWLAECCAASTVPNARIKPGIRKDMIERLPLAMRDSSASERFSLEVFLDHWSLAIQYQLDVDRSIARLVEMVRGKVS